MKLNRLATLCAASALSLAFAVACGEKDSGGDGDGDGTGGTGNGDGDGDGTGGTGNGDGDGDGGMGGGMGGNTAEDFTAINELHSKSIDFADDLYGVSFTSSGLIYVVGNRNVAGASADLDDAHVVVARFTAAGELDKSFDTDGVVELNAIANADDSAASGKGAEASSAITALADGGAMVAINANSGAAEGGRVVILARLTSAGALNTNFDTDGYKTISLSGWDNAAWSTAGGTDAPSESVYDIDVDNSGSSERVVLFGNAPAPAGESPARFDNDRYVARVLAADGSLDTTFSGDGIHSIDFGGRKGSDGGRRGVVLADGSSYSFGYTNYAGEEKHHIEILALDAAGAPKSGVGFQSNAASCGTAQTGVICANPFIADKGWAEAYGGAVQSDGSIVTSGYGGPTDAPGQDVVSFRFGASSMDSSYGVAGALIIDSGDEDRGRDIIALEDDRLLHVGKYNAAAAIYVTDPDGKLWDGFGQGGIKSYTHDGNFRGVAQHNGMIAVVADGGTGSAQLVILQVAD